MFTSRSAESYDPAPYMQVYSHPVHIAFSRRATSGDGAAYSPRPDFEPTRDPLPLVNWATGTRYPDDDVASYLTGHSTPGDLYKWDPRDRNRNRILIEFRKASGSTYQKAIWFLDYLDGDVHDWRQYPIEEKEHARRVLSKLLAVSDA